MSLILCLDTATKACTVALWKDYEVVAKRDVLEEGYTHAERLHSLIDSVIRVAGIPYSALDAIAVGKGPGSYTGLRIGVSTAKGLAYSLEKPLISLPTLQIMSAMAIQDMDENGQGILRPMLDARRMEVYSAAYDFNLKEQNACKAHILDEGKHGFEENFARGPVYFFGDGMEKCRNLLSTRHNAHFIPDVYPSAAHMGQLAEEKLERGDVEDTAYFEPFYLKEFVAKPAKKLL
jgi:tRNA threonylcarbamoyladenosine biosynthesis protein TsaB